MKIEYTIKIIEDDRQGKEKVLYAESLATVLDDISRTFRSLDNFGDRRNSTITISRKVTLDESDRLEK